MAQTGVNLHSNEPSDKPAPPRPLGLSRRQSFDPLTRAGKSTFSLGPLPGPHFGDLPTGATSVPAIDVNRRLGGHHFSPSVHDSDGGLTTPGGSRLPIGGEVFGSGGKGKTPRESWGSKVTEQQGGFFRSNGGGTSTPRPEDVSRPPETDKPAAAWRTTAAKALEPQQPSGGYGAFAGASPEIPPPGSTSVSSSSSGNNPPASQAPRSLYAGDAMVGGGSDPASTSSSLSVSTANASAGASRSGSSSPGGRHQSNTRRNRTGAKNAPQVVYSAVPSAAFDVYSGPQTMDDLTYGMHNMGIDQSQYRNAPMGASPPFGSPHEQPTGSPFYNVPGNAGAGRTSYRVPEQYEQPTYFQSGSPSPPVQDFSPFRRDSTTSNWGSFAVPFYLPPEYTQSNSGGPPSAASSRHPSFSFSPVLPPQGTTYGHPAGAPTFADSPLHNAPSSAYISTAPSMGVPRDMRGAAVDYSTGMAAPPPPMAMGYGTGYQTPMGAPQGRQGGGNTHHHARIIRSPLLEEFRASRSRNWTLPMFANHIVEFSGDQIGSRYIQSKLEVASSDEKQLVFDEILPNLLQLSTDVFANYVIQKFFELGSQAQKTAMVQVIQGHVLELSLQMYGCRVVQKALECALLDQQIALVMELDGQIVRCAQDAQANHVLQRAIERVPNDRVEFVFQACENHIAALASHPYGCRVVQRIFENCSPEQGRPLMEELHAKSDSVMQDQYGNYVVQWVLERGDPADRSRIVNKVFGRIVSLSKSKFASNVIEKCVVHSSKEEKQRMLEEVLRPGPSGTSAVRSLLTDSYGNYPLQKFLQTATGPQREKLYVEVSEGIANLRHHPATATKHLVSIEKLLNAEQQHKSIAQA